MVTVFLEGGGNDAHLKRQCREGFGRLLKSCGFEGRMPRLVACGSRNEAYDDFKNVLARASDGDLFMLLVDSEDPVTDINRTWNHLRQRDNWQKPVGAEDEDVPLMTTCMETWIVADRSTLSQHCGQRLHESALPSLHNLENRNRRDVLRNLEHATRCCTAQYAKGPKSFVVLGKLNPDVLQQYLPSFRRARSILDSTLS